MENVYPPSEDTFLLCDSIELTTSDSFLEVGCGTGYISLNAACIASRAVASDISLDAVLNSRRNAVRNRLDTVCQVVQSNLLSAFRKRDLFSVIAFNPPYLPSDSEDSSVDSTVVGGRRGVEIAERFIQDAVHHLAERGSIYVVVSSLARSRGLENVMKDNSLKVSLIKSSQLFFERISVLRGTLRKPFYNEPSVSHRNQGS